MPVAVVTGANSGIGHAWARLLIVEGYKVHAADVNIGQGIMSLGCEVSHLDVSSESSIYGFAASFKSETIDVLLNVAGVMFGHEKDSLNQVDLQTLEKTFTANTFGPLLLTQALLPSLLKSKRPLLGFVSSRVGSIADNRDGGMYAYRSSKSALNMMAKNLAIDLRPKGVVVSILHPGIVVTGLDGTTHSNREAVQPDEAARKLWNIMKDKQIADTGKFWHRENYELQW